MSGFERKMLPGNCREGATRSVVEVYLLLPTSALDQQLPLHQPSAGPPPRELAGRNYQIALAITSFMISLVPPKMRVTRASRQRRAIRYSFI